MRKPKVYELENDSGNTQRIIANSKRRVLELTTLENPKASTVELLNENPKFGMTSENLEYYIIYEEEAIEIIDEEVYENHKLELAFKSFRKSELKRIHRKIDEGLNALEQLQGLNYSSIDRAFDDLVNIKNSIEMVLGMYH